MRQQRWLESISVPASALQHLYWEPTTPPHCCQTTCPHRPDWPLVASRLQQTEHEIARYLESTGGKLTDTVERQIGERLYPHSRGRLF
jgi:hypothetical protein